MVIEMLVGALYALMATFLISLISSGPSLKILTFDTDDAKTCVENNKHYISHVCTYPGQKHPCLYESVGVNGNLFRIQSVFKDRLGTMMHIYDIGRLAELLCDRTLEQDQIYDQYCCHTKKCWFWCYAKKTRARRSKKARQSL